MSLGWTEAPCGRCPVFSFCKEGGPIDPDGCTCACFSLFILFFPFVPTLNVRRCCFGGFGRLRRVARSDVWVRSMYTAYLRLELSGYRLPLRPPCKLPTKKRAKESCVHLASPGFSFRRDRPDQRTVLRQRPPSSPLLSHSLQAREGTQLICILHHLFKPIQCHDFLGFDPLMLPPPPLISPPPIPSPSASAGPTPHLQSQMTSVLAAFILAWYAFIWAVSLLGLQTA